LLLLLVSVIAWAVCGSRKIVTIRRAVAVPSGDSFGPLHPELNHLAEVDDFGVARYCFAVGKSSRQRQNLVLRGVVERKNFTYRILACTNRWYVPPCPAHDSHLPWLADARKW
jgi:hypothetical protein